MEYLDGVEYVVDSVSRDGEHRICAIWEYDKRRANGTNFVYFGMELRPATSKVCTCREDIDSSGTLARSEWLTCTQRVVVTPCSSSTLMMRGL